MRKAARTLLATLMVLLPVLLTACGTDSLGDGLPEGLTSESNIHPAGYDAPEKHGAAFLADQTDCFFCHGDQLQGGFAEVSCASCHPGWQTNCTFCHSAASTVNVEQSAFETPIPKNDPGAHTAHVRSSDSHTFYGCALCHEARTSISTDGHLLDQGDGDLRFGDLAGEHASYTNGVCSNIYCHGNGQQPSGDVAWSVDSELGCSGCHGDETDPSGMSGDHKLHLDLSIRCQACHGEVMNADNKFESRELHVNGARDLSLELGQYDPETGTCTDTCHADREW